MKGPWHFHLNPNAIAGGAPAHGRSLRDYVGDVAKWMAASNPPVAIDVTSVTQRLPSIIFKKFMGAMHEKDQPSPRPEIVELIVPRKAFLAAVADLTAAGP